MTTYIIYCPCCGKSLDFFQGQDENDQPNDDYYAECPDCFTEISTDFSGKKTDKPHLGRIFVWLGIRLKEKSK